MFLLEKGCWMSIENTFVIYYCYSKIFIAVWNVCASQDCII